MKLILETEKGKRIETTSFPFIVGRNPDCHYTLEGNLASRKHAQFTVDGEKLLLEDLNSSNGTFVNMGKISTPVEIHKGDLLKFADVRMKVILGPERS